jgi:hypothetical protein
MASRPCVWAPGVDRVEATTRLSILTPILGTGNINQLELRHVNDPLSYMIHVVIRPDSWIIRSLPVLLPFQLAGQASRIHRAHGS